MKFAKFIRGRGNWICPILTKVVFFIYFSPDLYSLWLRNRDVWFSPNLAGVGVPPALRPVQLRPTVPAPSRPSSGAGRTLLRPSLRPIQTARPDYLPAAPDEPNRLQLLGPSVRVRPIGTNGRHRKGSPEPEQTVPALLPKPFSLLNHIQGSGEVRHRLPSPRILQGPGWGARSYETRAKARADPWIRWTLWYQTTGNVSAWPQPVAPKQTVISHILLSSTYKSIQ